MSILSWSCVNLFGYKELSVDLSTLGRTILLAGLNKDFTSTSSNGAGKSSVIEALCWTLFGRTIRGLEEKAGKDAVIFERGTGGAKGVCNLALDGKRLVIERFRRDRRYSNGVRLTVDGKDVTRRYTRDTEKAIVKVLGFNFDLFKRAVVIHSRITESFSSLNDRYLKFITERLIGVPEMDSLKKITDSTIAAYADTISTLDFKIERIAKELTDKQRDVASLEVLEKQYADKRKQELEEKAEGIRKVLEELELKHKRLSTRLDLRQRKPAKIKIWLRQEEEKYSRGNQDVVELSNKLTEYRATDKYNLEMLKKYKRIKDATVCPTCSQKVNPSQMKQHLSLYKTALKRSLLQSSEAKLELENLRYKQHEYHSGMEQIERTLHAVENEIHNLTVDIKALAVSIQAHKDALQEIQDEEQENSNPYTEMLIEARKAYESLTKELFNSKLLRKKKERAKQYYDFWKIGFGPDGMRAYLLDAVTPELNRLANIYLEHLTDNTVSIEMSTVSANKDGTYRDKFSISIDNTIGSKNLVGNSDGEIACVDLALNLAMSDVLEDRLRHGLGLLYIDQAIDLTDPVRGEKAAALLSLKTDPNWCKEVDVKPKEHVFCITHREQFKRLFESTIFVEKENGVCRRKT